MDRIVWPNWAVGAPLFGWVDLVKGLARVDAGHAALHGLAAVEMLDQPAAQRSIEYVWDHEHGRGRRLVARRLDRTGRQCDERRLDGGVGVR